MLLQPELLRTRAREARKSWTSVASGLSLASSSASSAKFSAQKPEPLDRVADFVAFGGPPAWDPRFEGSWRRGTSSRVLGG